MHLQNDELREYVAKLEEQLGGLHKELKKARTCQMSSCVGGQLMVVGKLPMLSDVLSKAQVGTGGKDLSNTKSSSPNRVSGIAKAKNQVSGN